MHATLQPTQRRASLDATQSMTVLYDADCPLCVRAWRWFSAQPTFFRVRFLAQGTDEAGRRYPALNVGAGRAAEDLIVVTDDGRVYRNTRAWIMCFYALRQYRSLAFRLSHPTLMPLARRAYHAVSNNRMWLGRYFGAHGRKISNKQLADRIRTHSAPTDNGCHETKGLCVIDTDHQDPAEGLSRIYREHDAVQLAKQLNQRRAELGPTGNQAKGKP